MFSCGFEKHFEKVDGDGNVLTKTRAEANDFKKIYASSGLEVIIEQSSQKVITIEADENLHQHIKTEVKDGVLEITTDANLRNAKAMRVIVQLPVIEGLETSGGASLSNKGTIKAGTIAIETGGGSDMNITVNAELVKCETSSGSHLGINGTAQKLESESSSGSHFDAKGLVVKTVEADASSGAHAYVNPTEDLSAEASSGAHIYYKSTPSNLSKKSSSGGEVSQQ